MDPSSDLADALLAAPLGVATLARLEWRAGDAEMRGSEAPPSSPTTVAAAVVLVETMSFPELIELALWAGVTDVGPWISEAPWTAAAAYRDAEARRPIAVAVAERFGDELHRPVDENAQQWWTTAVDPSDARRTHVDAPLFGDFDHVYGAGQFTWRGLWSVTDPPVSLHESLRDVWEMYPEPIIRWHLPVRPDARVFEIHRPDHWVRLVTTHPAPARPGQEDWELPDGNTIEHSVPGTTSYVQPADDGWFRYAPGTAVDDGSACIGAGAGGYEEPGEDATTAIRVWSEHPEGSIRAVPVELLEVPGQHAARGSIRQHLVPDWASVARDWDGVHLSWAGLLTAEGFVSDLPDGDVAMLRYWFSERTLWLADVFGEPEPLGAADLAGLEGDDEHHLGALDLRDDATALERERARLHRLLGR